MDADNLFEMVESRKFQYKRVFIEANDDDACGITDSKTLKELINQEIIAFMRDDKELTNVSKNKAMAFWLSKTKNSLLNLAKLACLFLSGKKIFLLLLM